MNALLGGWGFSSHRLFTSLRETKRVAREYIRPDSMTVVVVGDVQKIRPGIERLGLGPVHIRTP